MIKKKYHKIPEHLRQLSLYWKTWIITILTLVSTLILFFFLFSLFATKFLEDNQQSKFDRNVNDIEEHIKLNGLDEEFLSQYSLKGYTIIVMLKGEVIYPLFLNRLSTSEESQIPLMEDRLNSNTLHNVGPGLSENKVISHKKNLLNVDIFYPAIVDPGEIKTILIGIIPYFILTGIIVACGVSWLYSRYFTDKINHLNSLVHHMSTRSIPNNYEKINGDELQELKNNIYYMYEELESTFSLLNVEVERVQCLESDRQVFMRGATHELKTPIMAMMTTIADLMDGINSYENQNFQLSQCYNRLESMSSLVNEMLEISRLEAVVFAGETDLTQTTIEMLDIYEYMITDQELSIKIDQFNILNVKIPERSLQKVISNLIGNSVKYSSAKSRIKILSTLSYWEIRNQVTDVDQVNIETIFDPFVSFDLRSGEEVYEKSHGLGLYIVAAILKQYEYDYVCYIDYKTEEFVFKIRL